MEQSQCTLVHLSHTIRTGVLSWVKTGSIHAHTGHMDLDQQSVVSGLEKGSDVRTQ